jgi:hypothetical protein
MNPPDEPTLQNLGVLLAALQVLGMDGAAQSFVPRLAKLRAAGKA